MNNKQTAIEWLVEQLSNYDSKMVELFKNEIKQAKEIEKQQIIDACDNAHKTDFYVKYYDAEQYYNETFNK